MSDNKSLQKARNNQLISLMLVAFGGFVGVGFFFMFAHSKKKHEVAMQWPTVEGKIVKSKIVARKKIDRVGRGVARTTEYDHEWVVTYQVNGEHYRREYKDNYSSESLAHSKQEKRRKGTTIPMHFNPQNPGQSRYHSDDHISPWVGAFFGGFIVFVGAMMYWYNSSRVKKLEGDDQARLHHAVRAVQSLEAEESLMDQLDAMPRPESDPPGGPAVELDSMKYFKTVAN